MKILENIKKNTILILGVTVIVLYFLLKDNFNEIVHNLQQIRIEYIILAFLFFLAYVSLKGFVNYLIINDKEKIPVKEAITQNFISQFFNGITPFATGGEPMAVYMLMERKISFANATHYMVLSFIFYQISLVLFGFFAVGYNYTVGLFPEVKILQNLVLIGFIINIFVVLILLLSYSNRFIKFIRGIVVKICKKLRINRTEEDIYQKFEDYHNGLVELKNRKPLIGMGLVLNMISLICLYSVPYWIIRGMGVENMSFINTIVSSAYVYLIGVFVPIPGASGGIEYGFTQFFGNFLTPSVVSAVIIVWRFMTYYMGILIGAILFNLRKKEE